MSGAEFLNAVLLPVGLGLIGFVEPCSIGSTVVFIKALEGRSDATKIRQVAIFTATRAVFIGLLGVLAVVVGSAFLTFQKAAWLVLGGLYAAIGLFYVSRRAGVLMTTLGPGLSRLSGARGSAALGVLFGLNVPACAAPLLFALLGTAAAGGAAGAGPWQGFLSLGLFGFVLSLPLALAVMFPVARRLLDRFAGLSRRLPVLTGLLMIVLGAWSVWFGLFVTATPTA